MSNAIGSSRESNPSRRICHLRAVPLGHVVDVPRSLVIYSMSDSRSTLMEGTDSLSQDTPFVPAALELLRDASELGTSATRWADHRWSMRWREDTFRLHSFFDDVDAFLLGMGLSRPAWVGLHRLRTGVGHFGLQCINGAWLPRRPVSMVQRIRPYYNILSHIPPSK